MNNCYQFKGQSILDHGLAVYNEYAKLLQALSSGQLDLSYPTWLQENKDYILANQLPLDVMTIYLVYHDCGKWLCEKVDDQGKTHFPDHASVSQELWVSLFEKSIVSDLIGRDMDMHLLKPSQAKDYDKKELVPSLLLAALAELKANATMFGGESSTSFKIKFKALSRLGNALLRKE